MRSLGSLGLALIGAMFPGAAGCGADDPVREEAVLFVCEHGAAKSVMATALFNARASERGLAFRARSRGVAPDRTLHPRAVAGLREDGLEPGREPPTRLERRDVDRAAVVVAFDPLPTDIAAGARITTWDVPPVSVDYAAARDAMMPRIDALLDELARRGGSGPRPRD